MLKKVILSVIVAVAMLWPVCTQAEPGHVGRWKATNFAGVFGTFESPVSEAFLDIGIDSHGNVIGITNFARVLKYSPSGQLLWEKDFNQLSAEKTFEENRDYIFSAMDITNDDDILIVGWRGMNSNAPNPGEEFVIKLDSNGNQLWYVEINPRGSYISSGNWGEPPSPWAYDSSWNYDTELNDYADIHTIPGTDEVLVSSGYFFVGTYQGYEDIGEYGYVKIKINDGTVTKQWKRGSPVGRFFITPDGKYAVEPQTLTFTPLKEGISPKQLSLLITGTRKTPYLAFTDSEVAAITLVELEKYEPDLDIWGNDLMMTRLSVETNQLLSRRVWGRGYRPGNNERRIIPTGIFYDSNKNLIISGYFYTYDPNAYWEKVYPPFSNYGEVAIGYITALNPNGSIIKEVICNNHRKVKFFSMALDATGKVVVAGYREEPYQTTNEGYWRRKIIPFIISDALGQLPPYRYIRTSVQHRIHDPVEPVTGNFAETATDLTYPTAGIPLSAIRTYSSRFADRIGMFGYGWQFNLGMHIESTENGITVFWGDGHGDDFVVQAPQNGTTAYTPLGPDTGYTLTETLTDTEHYFTVHIKNLDRTIRFGHEDEGKFYPTLMFKGEDENAASAFPLSFTYQDGPPRTMVVTDVRSNRALTIILDDSGRITRIEGPDSAVFQYTYDANGDLVQVQRADGSVVEYIYDNSHHLTEIHQGGKTLLQNTYDDAGRVITQTDALGHITTFSYDDSARKNTITGPDGKKTFYYYDSEYRITRIEDETGAARTYTYDALTGKLASITEPDGSTTSFSYDENGNLVQKTDPMGRTTTYAYDDQGHILSSSTPGGITVGLSYDENGRLSSYTLPRGGAYALSYGEDGKLASIQDPLGATETLERDGSGLVSARNRRDGVRVSYERDAAGRVISKTYDGANPVTYTFDAFGRVTSVTDASGTVSYAYNERGLRSQETNVGQETVTYDYDDAGRTTGLHALSLILTTERDAAGRPTVVTDNFGHEIRYTYDSTGRLTRIEGPSGISVNYAFDAAGRVATITFRDGNGTQVRRMDIERDQAGRITRVNDQGAPGVSRLPQALSLSFDLADRITSQDAEYDPSGRLTAFSGKTYGYDIQGRLVSVAIGDRTVTLGRDPLGRVKEIQESEAGTTLTRKLVYAGLVPVAEKDESGEVRHYFILGPGMGLVLDKEGQIEAVLLSDWRKNLVTALDTSGNILSQRLYSPYGLVVGEEGAWPVALGFLGEAGIYTLSTGEVLTRNRAYDPETARFITPDPSSPNPMQPLSLNRYAYAWDDPVNLLDTAGLSPFAPTGPMWLIPCVGGVIGCNVRPTMHPTNTLAGVAGPPMGCGSCGFSAPGSGGFVADATPIYSDRSAEEGGGNPAITPEFTDPEGLIASPIYSDRDSELPPPMPQDAPVAPGEGYVAAFYTLGQSAG